MVDRRVFGKPYWFVAVRIFGIAAENWGTINGECQAQGVNLRKMHPEDFSDLVLHFVTRNMDSKETDAFYRKLYMPPVGEEPDDDNPVWGIHAEMKAFEKTSKGKGIDRE